MQIAQFLNKFDMHVRGKLAGINHTLTHLERQVEFVEASLIGFEQRASLQSALRQGDEGEDEYGADGAEASAALAAAQSSQ